LDHGLITFDSDMFGMDKATGIIATDMEMFSILESFSRDSDDETQTGSTSPQSSPEPTTTCSTGSEGEEDARKVSNKRTKSFSSESSEDVEAKPKKSKASPRHPRSRLPTSAYRGVSRCTKDGRWQARIRIAKEVVYLGRYPTEEQAARRYDEAARVHHGLAAMLNFVTSEDLQLGRKSVFSEKSGN